MVNPLPYISACQFDICHSIDKSASSCNSFEAYARECAKFDVCLQWRSEDLCHVECSGGMGTFVCNLNFYSYNYSIFPSPSPSPVNCEWQSCNYRAHCAHETNAAFCHAHAHFTTDAVLHFREPSERQLCNSTLMTFSRVSSSV